MKTCNTCGTDRPLEHFHRHRTSKGGRRGICKFCATAKVKEYALRHPDRVRLTQRKCRLKQRYGLTLEDYDAMLAAQGHKCALCRRGADEVGGPGGGFVVDHDHDTGQVRAVLCHRCNRFLGWLEADRDRMARILGHVGVPWHWELRGSRG